MARIYTFIFVVFLATGCGSGNVGLRGTVTFSDDGSPLTVGTVGFLKDGKIARGTIKKDGTYIVGFEKETDGLPPGQYNVVITGAEIPIGENLREQLIDKKYSNPDTSELTLEVNASTRVFDVQVDRFQKR